MKAHCPTLTFIAACLSGLPLSNAWADPAEDLQVRRLLQPTPAELAAEQRGNVFIYDGLGETDIDRALNEEFDRAEHMMFVRVRYDQPEADEYLLDDGCD